jgi:Mg-chelatase subunit ChlD
VLTLVLAFSLLPIGGMAGQEDTALPTVSIAHNGEERTQTGANGESITTQKTISSVSGSNNQFDITLNVRTVSNSQTTITSGKAAHVVVVIDTSASMKDEGRMSSAKAAASSFIKDMLTNTNSSNKIAVVKYDNSATTLAQLSSDKETLTNVVNQINYNSNGGTNIQGGLKMARDILAADTDTGVSKIILLLSDGEPTYSYRLSGTATIGCSSWTDWFGESHHNFNGNLSNINVTGCNYTTLVGCGGSYYATDAAYTDGRLGNAQNNLYITATCTHGYVVSGNVRYNGGSSIINQGYANNGYATIWEAGQSKEAGTEIYSVMLKGNATSKSVMKSIATNSAHYQETDNVSALTQLFKNISSTVNNSAGGSTVTDPMSQYVALNAESIQTNTAASGAIVLGEPKTGEASVNEASTTISWDLSKATGNASTITNGSSSTTTTVYQLKYRVTVARNAAFYDAVKASTYTDKGVATNGTTFVNYTIGGTDGVLTLMFPGLQV